MVRTIWAVGLAARRSFKIWVRLSVNCPKAAVMPVSTKALSWPARNSSMVIWATGAPTVPRRESCTCPAVRLVPFWLL